ncbi:hypothetical protein D3C76_946000 [compost metagenome]
MVGSIEAASAKVVDCANIIKAAMTMAMANALPPMPKPMVAVRITGLAMISPTVLASAVGKPTVPWLRCSVSLLLNDILIKTLASVLAGRG